MLQDFILPDLGEGIHEGEILEVHVAAGDAVKEGDVVLVVETDKAAVELPSPYTGTVLEIRVGVGDVVHVGEVMIVYEVSNGKEAGAEKTKKEKTAPPEKEKMKPPAAVGASAKKQGPVPASPATRRLARELGVDLHDVSGSGPGGLVTSEDVRAYAKTPQKGVDVEAETSKAEAILEPPPSPTLPDFSKMGPVEQVPLRSIRKVIARKMALSWSQIPHVSHQDQADITDLEKIRKQNQKEVEEHHGKLTLTVFALKAAAAALEAFPRFNSSLDMERGEIIIKKYCHIGVATDTERGLVVPVIRDVNHKDMLELARELSQISQKAREAKLGLEETTGGTFTITNIGSIGGTGFQPIINFPEVAILGLGRARWQPVVSFSGKNDEFSLEPRLMLPLVLAFDHRVLDGAEAARFVNDVKETLERPSRMLFFEQ
ncbi:MAG: 2-oxo acid dehydrogenase subunit E2 [Desulfobulbaceae bacterium]|nr:2-oxo acid dehydrogenase subunit E2 [Desulfobulbaceae bacterium]